MHPRTGRIAGASPPNKIIVNAPATTANLGPGFDVFGLSLGNPSDRVEIVPISKGIQIKISGLASNSIPSAPEKNTAGVVANRILEEFSLRTGLLIKIEKGILPGVGLGSSAASAAAVAFGLDRLFSLRLNPQELVRIAAKGEIASAGFEHADNVSAAIYGNFVVIRSYSPLDIINLVPPPNLGLCVAIPKVPSQSRKTEKARSVLPKTVSLKQLSHNVGHAAAMVAGFVGGDVDLIGKSMSDSVVEPARKFLIPGYERVKEKALKAGACGVAISGAGPAMLAIIDKNKTNASKVAQAMVLGFRSVEVDTTTICTRPGKGVSMIEMK